MSNLQEEHGLIDTKIVCELIEIMPYDREQVTLEVNYFSDGEIEKYSHTIININADRKTIIPSEEIYDRTRELSLLFKKYGHQWTKVVYKINLDVDGDWQYKVNFEY